MLFKKIYRLRGLGYALLTAVVAALLYYTATRTPVVAVVHGASMEPGLAQGDCLACSPGWHVGCIAVLEDPGRDRLLVKRVVAEGPCEATWDASGRVCLDGETLDEPYARYGPGACGAGGCFVPDGYVFVAGDNRGLSYDSRQFGPVPSDNIRGTASFQLPTWICGTMGGLDDGM